MYSVELPKQLFKRFENCRYNVRVINNCAKCAAAIVEYSNKKSYKIEAGCADRPTVIDNTYKTVCQ